MIPQKNNRYIIEIESVSSDGNGIGRTDGFIVFVPGTVTGDVVSVLIVKVLKNYAYAKLLEIIKASEKRVDVPCKAFGKCGGCSLLHIKYDYQLEIKKGIIENALKHIAGTEKKVDEMIGSESAFRYRNKMIFPVGEDKEGNTVCGFFRERSHDIIPVDDCLLGDKFNQKIIDVLKNYMEEYNVSAYSEEEHKGIIRRLFTRKGTVTGEIMIVISINADTLPQKEKLIEAFCAVSENIVSIILNINKKRTNLVLGEKNITVYGKNNISDVLCETNYEISLTSFYQVNHAQTERLYRKVTEYAEITQDDTVLDIYCGIGSISLAVAKYAKKVIGVEIIPSAIENAKDNAAKNGILNAEFYCADAAEFVPQFIKNNTPPDVVILDPPRKGSDEKTLGVLALANPERIIYVSCNPATLARDVKFLDKFGYKTTKLCGVDMFPNTSHIETVCLLRRENGQKRVEFTIDVEKLKGKTAGYATYNEIKEYIEQNYGFKVSSLYIAQIKQKHGIIQRENYNIGEGKSKCPECPPEKQKAIEDAFRFFGMID